MPPLGAVTVHQRARRIADESSQTTEHTDAGHPTADTHKFAKHGVSRFAAPAQRKTSGRQPEDAERHGEANIAGPPGPTAGYHRDVHERFGHGVGDHEKRYGLVKKRRRHVLP